MAVRLAVRAVVPARGTVRASVPVGSEPMFLDDLSISGVASRQLVVHAIEVGCPVLAGGEAGAGTSIFSAEGGIPAAIFSEDVLRPPNLGGDMRLPAGSVVAMTLESLSDEVLVVEGTISGRRA